MGDKMGRALWRISILVIVILLNGRGWGNGAGTFPFPDNPFGIGGPAYSHMAEDKDAIEKGREQLNLFTLTGAQWARQDFWWDRVEVEKGKWNWDYFDKAVPTYCEAGVNVLGILCYGSQFHGKDSPLTAEDQEAFGKYVYEIVRRYKNTIPAWEVWNEPNILPFWAPKPRAADYASLLKIAYREAKRANPDGLVLGMVTAGVDEDFIRGVYEAGAGDAFDVLSFHTYGNNPTEEGVFKEARDLRAIMAKYPGADRPIWLTETGIYTGPSGVSEEVQARRIVRSTLTWVSAGVDKVFQLTLRDWSDDPKAIDAMSFRGLLHASGETKPSFYAHRTMGAKIGDKEFVGRVNPAPGVRGLLFEKDGRRVLVLWAISDDPKDVVEAELALDGASFVVTDLYGKEVALRRANGQRLNVRIGPDPIYIEGCGPAQSLQARLQPVEDPVRVAKGSKAEVRLHLSGEEDLPEGSLMWATAPLTPENSNLPHVIAKKGERNFALPVLVERDAEKPIDVAVTVQMPIEMRTSDLAQGCFVQYVRLILQPAVVLRRGENRSMDPSKPLIQFGISNMTPDRIKGAAIFDPPDDLGVASESKVELGPGQTVMEEGELRVGKIQALKKYVIRATFKSETISEALATTETFLPVPRRGWEVKVDGKLNEWRGREAQVRPEQMKEEDFNPSRNEGLKDLAATTWLAWDDSGLYMAIEAKDDHLALSDVPTVWDYDSLQIACDPLRDAEPRTGFEREDFELEIARMRDGKVFLDAGRFPEGKIESVVEQTVKVAVEPLTDGAGLAYEIFIPAELFHPAKWEKFSLLGFNFILNDNDGEGREGWWELAPGIGYGKEPFQYPAMWLVEKQQEINSQDRQDKQD